MHRVAVPVYYAVCRAQQSAHYAAHTLRSSGSPQMACTPRSPPACLPCLFIRNFCKLILQFDHSFCFAYFELFLFLTFCSVHFGMRHVLFSTGAFMASLLDESSWRSLLGQVFSVILGDSSLTIAYGDSLMEKRSGRFSASIFTAKKRSPIGFAPNRIAFSTETFSSRQSDHIAGNLLAINLLPANSPFRKPLKLLSNEIRIKK